MPEANLDKFMSDDVKEILNFYDSFSNREELIEWIKDVPKSSPEVNIIGNQESEVAVVIPTPAIDHPLALYCRDNVFEGLKLYFSVDSSFLFNLSRSYNIGGKSLSNDKNIRWVIFSNVDMVRIDPSNKISKELSKLNDRVKFCYAREDGSHSYRVRIGEYTYLRKVTFSLLGKTRKLRSALEKRFSIHLNAEDDRHWLTRRFVTNYRSLMNFGDFFIFSVDLLKQYDFTPFDEFYLNGMEDIDLSLRLFQDLDSDQIKAIDYRVGSMESGVRGRDLKRVIRSIPSLAYFNEKIEKIL